MAASDADDSSQDDILIALMGQTGTGKSSFINKAAAASLLVGNTLESCTKDIQQAELRVDGRKMILIDSPGFDDTDLTDIDILRLIGIHLQQGARQKKFLTGVIYMRRITDNRMQNSALNNLHVLRKLCGSDNYGRIALVTTHWDLINTQEGVARESQLRTTDMYWGNMIKHGATFNRHDNTADSALEILRQFIDKQKTPFMPKFLEEFLAAGGNIAETSAGQEVLHNLITKLQQYEDQIEKLTEENKRAKFEKLRMETEIDRLRMDILQMKEDRQRERQEEKHREQEIREALKIKEKLITDANAERQRVDGEIGALRAQIAALEQKQAKEKSLEDELNSKRGRVDEVKLAKEEAESQIQDLERDAGGSEEDKETTQAAKDESKAKDRRVAAAHAAKDAAESEMTSLITEINRLQLEVENQRAGNEDLESKLQRLRKAEISKQEADKKRKIAEAAIQDLRREETQLESSKRREGTVKVAVEAKERQISQLGQGKQVWEGDIEFIAIQVKEAMAKLDDQKRIKAKVEKTLKEPEDDIYDETRGPSKRWSKLPYCSVQ